MSTDQEQWKLADLEPERVRFGDLPNQTMPHEWAGQFLRIVHAEYPAVFRAILPRLYGLPEPEKRGARR